MTKIIGRNTAIYCIAAAVGCMFVTPLLADCPPAEVYKVIASDGGSGDELGNAVAIDGSYMVIGADHYDASPTLGNSGAVYVYDVATGLELYKFRGSDENLENRLGSTVAIEGTVAIAGAAFNTNTNGTYAGAVFVFDVTTGTELMKLTASDGHGDQRFGSAVNIDGNMAIIGALGDDNNGEYTGAAYIFDLTTGAELHKLIASDNQTERRYFGSTADIQGNYAAVGGWADNDQGSMAGSVYVFDTTTGAELYKLTPPTTGDSQSFGSGDTVAIEGDMLLVGAPGKGKGHVYVYDLPSGQLIGDLSTPNVSGFAGNFGTAVDVEGDIALISASSDSSYGMFAGSAFIFDLTTGAELAKFKSSDLAAEDYFGWEVAIDGNNAVVGANFDDNANGNDAGSAYLFNVAPQCASLAVSPEPLIAGQDGTFTVTDAKPSEGTYLAYSLKGVGSTFVPTLNITLDLKQPQQAGNTQSTDATGFVEWVLAIPSAAAGRNLWFQAAQFELKSNVIATSVQ